MAEFTGERVIPGKVDADLWNEHYARYTFAARLARLKCVLDVGCGAGYGSRELANTARQVIGLDPAAEALAYGRGHYAAANLLFTQGTAEALPFAGGSFQLVVAFEVIEHLEHWPALLEEARRVLAPAGQFIVSTPNKLYYEESRKQTGPNPFHVHEFEFAEFRDALANVFPHVSLFLENHSEGIVFQPVAPAHSADLRLEPRPAAPEESHFFLAVCAMSHQTGAPTYIYIPNSGNVLRERERHIERLEQELATKNQWLDEARARHAQLVEEHRRQTVELEQRNRWAEQLNRELEDANRRIVELQDQLQAEQAAAAEMAAQYEAKVAELDADNRAKTEWALETERRLMAELAGRAGELAKCVELLDTAEKTLEERTHWALALDEEVKQLQARLAGVSASRWVRMGRVLGLGPRIGAT